MISNKSRQNTNPQTDDPDEEMDLEESFRYVNFLLMWYTNRSSLNLANTIVAELERIKQKIKECEDGSKDEECQRLIMKTIQLFNSTKDFKFNWNPEQNA